MRGPFSFLGHPERLLLLGEGHNELFDDLTSVVGEPLIGFGRDEAPLLLYLHRCKIVLHDFCLDRPHRVDVQAPAQSFGCHS